MNKFSYFTLIIFFCENNFFQRGSGGGGGGSLPYFVEILEGWGAISSFKIWKIQGGWGGGGFLSEIPSVVEYGYFLELHNNIYVFF